MKAIPLLLLLLSTNLFALNVDKLVYSIGMIESGMNHEAVGDDGHARGACQMHRAAWIDSGNRLGLRDNWWSAHNPTIGRKYATAYTEILIERLTRHLERKPSPQEVYAAWRFGVGGFMMRGGYAGMPRHVKESCDRLWNIYSQ